ncbi:hypothetical protein MtrunA17_Chr7g0267871 [Medicago truncatula]|uniref:Uncharacterized protein n=1 Tax=Medicago truncatula TaxID=3880 RepID=A0A396H7T5_MEDTR|nr:hypothetical protein MtrunA17_Chr7g0267871 [Medicago truncatula]
MNVRKNITPFCLHMPYSVVDLDLFIHCFPLQVYYHSLVLGIMEPRRYVLNRFIPFLDTVVLVPLEFY